MIPVLPPTETVDLCQERGRHLDETHPALDDRGGEPGEVADHPAADRDQMVAARNPEVQERIDQDLQRRPTLPTFAGGQQDCGAFETGRGQAGEDGIDVDRDILITHHRDPPVARDLSDLFPGAREQSVLDLHGIAALAEPDGHVAHRPIARRIAATVASCGPGWLAIRSCACA